MIRMLFKICSHIFFFINTPTSIIFNNKILNLKKKKFICTYMFNICKLAHSAIQCNNLFQQNGIIVLHVPVLKNKLVWCDFNLNTVKCVVIFIYTWQKSCCRSVAPSLKISNGYNLGDLRSSILIFTDLQLDTRH